MISSVADGHDAAGVLSDGAEVAAVIVVIDVVCEASEDTVEIVLDRLGSACGVEVGMIVSLSVVIDESA